MRKNVGFIAMMPFWYPILHVEQLLKKPMHSLSFHGKPLIAYRPNITYSPLSVVIHSDICPHMGGSFCKGGWVDIEGHLHCPYHGFEYSDGRFINIPSMKKPMAAGGCILPCYSTMIMNDILYLHPIEKEKEEMMMKYSPLPYYPPEHNDPEFTMITGTRILECPSESLIENLLDMLHISFVHSFGNTRVPLPRRLHYEDLPDGGGKTTFEYEPNDFTISTRVGGTKVVRVENEFHLPSTTLTRVIAGKTIKTVFTQSVPLSGNRTKLFWTVYRNFWKDPNTDVFNGPGDWLLRRLMEKTLDEDASILSRTYPEARNGFLTRYDITIKKYREKRAECIKKNKNLLNS